MPGKAFDRAVRKNHITMSFVNRYKNGVTHEVTSSQVARALMLEPSAHVRGLLAELVKDGVLECRIVDDPQSAPLKNSTGKKALFQLSQAEREKLEKEKREVTVKVRGKNAGQLRMF